MLHELIVAEMGFEPIYDPAYETGELPVLYSAVLSAMWESNPVFCLEGRRFLAFATIKLHRALLEWKDLHPLSAAYQATAFLVKLHSSSVPPPGNAPGPAA